MAMFTVISDLKGDTRLVSSITLCRFLSKNQFVFCVNTELSPVTHSIAGGNPRLVQEDGLVSEDKEVGVDTLPAVLVYPHHVGHFLQSHSLGQIVVLHDSGHHLEETLKVTSPLELS